MTSAPLRASLPAVARDWSRELADELGRSVRVSFGRARREVIVARPVAGELHVRMHERFATAPADVRAAVAAWLRSGRRARRACARLDAWVEELARELGPPRRRTPPLRPRGEHHDLEELAREVVRDGLPPDLLPADRVPALTWGRRSSRKRRARTLQLGSYDSEHGLVRIHPVLDQPGVPRFFVRAVLHHELLHAALDRDDGTRPSRPHGPEFRRLERAHPDHERAQLWQEQHLSALLRSARTGEPLAARAPHQRVLRILGQGWLF